MITLSKLKKKLKGIGCYYPTGGQFDKVCELFLTEIATKIEENIKITSAFWTLSYNEDEKNNRENKCFGLFYTTENFVDFYSIQLTKEDKEKEFSHQQFDFKKITNGKISRLDKGDIGMVSFFYDNKELFLIGIDKKIPQNVLAVFMSIEIKSIFADKTKMTKLLEMTKGLGMEGLKGMEVLKGIENLKDLNKLKSDFFKQLKI